MWDIRATRICDTLAWFPTKVQMPLASFNDLILSGIHDIVHALRHPLASAPSAPLTDSHVNALTTLTMVLTSLVAPPPLLPAPAPPSKAAINTSQTPAPLLLPLPDPLPMFFPLPRFPPTVLVHVREQHRRTRHSPRSSPTHPPPLLKSAQTVHPFKTRCDSDVPARTPFPHHHGARSRKPLHHVAACVLANILADAHSTRAHRMPHYYALDGAAFNPDPGNLSEYKELSSQCSKGPLW